MYKARPLRFYRRSGNGQPFYKIRHYYSADGLFVFFYAEKHNGWAIRQSPRTQTEGDPFSESGIGQIVFPRLCDVINALETVMDADT